MAENKKPAWHRPDGWAGEVDAEDKTAPESPGAETAQSRLAALTQRLENWAMNLEGLRLSEYMRYVNDHRRMFWSNFFGGIARGVGMAVGFSVLGALLVWLLQDLARRNLPFIGDLLRRIMDAIGAK